MDWEYKVGEIKECIKVENSEKLLRLVVDFGEETLRVVFSGIAKYYEPNYLIGKKSVFVTNVPPKKMMGEESQAMIFAAGNDDNISILLLDKDMPIGTEVF